MCYALREMKLLKFCCVFEEKNLEFENTWTVQSKPIQMCEAIRESFNKFVLSLRTQIIALNQEGAWESGR